MKKTAYGGLLSFNIAMIKSMDEGSEPWRVAALLGACDESWRAWLGGRRKKGIRKGAFTYISNILRI